MNDVPLTIATLNIKIKCFVSFLTICLAFVFVDFKDVAPIKNYLRLIKN